MAITKIYEKVTMAGLPNDLITFGYTIGIHNAHTWTKEVLVAKINRKVDQLNGVTPINTNPNRTTRTRTTKSNEPKVMATTVDGRVVIITGKPEKDGKMILANRKMKVISQQGDNLIGHLIKENDGSLQRSQIVMPIKYTSEAKKMKAQ